jgi:hypothetical protein
MITDIPRDWLRQKGTAQEFEQARLEQMAAAFKLPCEKIVQKFGTKPFGEMTDSWHSFISRMEPEDELWFFSSPNETFVKKLGCQGYAIVRDGAICDTFVSLRT